MFLWTWAACTEGLRVDVAEIDGLTLARRFDVRGRDAVDIQCTSPTEPEEDHHVAGAGEVDLFGLLPDTTYRCTITSAQGTLTTEFHTTLPDGLPTWVTEIAAPIGGYTLFNHGRPPSWDDREAKLLLVDPDGRLRWYHEVADNPSDLDAQYLGDGRILFGGGYDAAPTIIGLDGQVEAEAGPSSTGKRYHHHAELVDGQIWSLTESTNALDDRTWTGFAIDAHDSELKGVEWSWDSQRAVDEGWLLPPAEGIQDAYHANALFVTADAVFVNLYTLARWLKIDRATGAHVWTMGPDEDFAIDDAAQWFKRSHAPELRGDEVLFYDNRPVNPPSRIARFAFDEDTRTAELVWEWTEPGWHEKIWGDVDELDDGHLLITKAHDLVTTGNALARTEIVEVDPADGSVAWRLRMDAEEDGGYRSARIDGCAIFANRRYCSE